MAEMRLVGGGILAQSERLVGGGILTDELGSLRARARYIAQADLGEPPKPTKSKPIRLNSSKIGENSSETGESSGEHIACAFLAFKTKAFKSF